MVQSQRTTCSDGINVVYDSYGSGDQALVFIHGWTCSSALWQAQNPLFTKYRSILIDLPGHGRSDGPSNIEYSLELFANAVNSVLEQEAVTKAVLIGHSLSGPVSTMVLRLFPSKVKAIVYVDSFFNLPDSYLTLAQRKAVAERHADDEKFRASLDEFWTAKSTDAIKAQVIETMMGSSKYVRCNATTTTAQPHMWRGDEVYNLPALSIIQPMFFQMMDPDWSRHIPKLETRLWEENGHFLFMEDPQRFNEEVEEWLTQNNLL